MPTLDQGWAALLGALVGGAFTFLGTYATWRKDARASQRKENALNSATALLIQDDFLHYQATLARALDGTCWWDPTQLLAQQATVEDRKRVWAVLGQTETNTVAGAQGWMDVLIQRRTTIAYAGPLIAHDEKLIRDVFCELERGREALHKLAGRDFVPFEASGVMKDLNVCKTMQALIGKPSCFP
jgi:hypothetical protein